MPKRRVLLDEFQLSILMPRDTTEADARAANRVLASWRFQNELRRIVAALLHKSPSLAQASVRISR